MTFWKEDAKKKKKQKHYFLNGVLAGDEANDTKEEYNEFIHGNCVKSFKKFAKFDHLVVRLDEFLGFYCNRQHFASLWKVCKVIFVLSHEQAGLDCSVSVNVKVLDENMQELSLVLQWMLYDHVTSGSYMSTRGSVSLAG